MESQYSAETAPFDGFVESTPGSSRYSIQWTAAMVSTLLETLVEQARLGKRAESGFKSEAYTAAMSRVQMQIFQKHPEGGYLQLTKDKLRTKVSSLKKLWTAWQTLQNESGFGLDPDTGLIVADDEVWARYINAPVRSLVMY